MPTDVAAEPVIRRAVVDESQAVADLMWAVREQSLALGFIPEGIHPLDDMRRWMRDVVFAHNDVWVADADGVLVGLMVLCQPDWLEHLYIDTTATGRGLGTRLLDVARSELSGDQVQLWTFQSNAGARRFYERHGFDVVQTTAGDNEEQAPDVRYVWRRRQPSVVQSVAVRPAQATDLAVMQAIYADVVDNHHASLAHSAPDLAYWEERLAELLPNDRLLVAVDDAGTVLGFAESYTFRPREGFDRTREVALYLDASARGRGVGRQLYTELLSQLTAAGNRMVFATVALPNDASVILHRRLGFEQVGLLPDIAEKFGKTWSTAYFTKRLGE